MQISLNSNSAMMRNILAILSLLVACIGSTAAIAQDVKLSVAWKPIEALSGYPDDFSASFEIKNIGNVDLPSDGWGLYYSSYPAPIIYESVTGGAKIERLQSELFRLVPTKDFKALKPGETAVIKYAAHSWLIKETDAPGGAYVVVKHGNEPDKGIPVELTIGSIPESNLRRSGMNGWLVSAQQHYDLNEKLLKLKAAAAPVLPTPKSMQLSDGTFALESSIQIVSDEKSKQTADLFAKELNQNFGLTVKVVDEAPSGAKAIHMKVDSTLGAETYWLTVKDNAIDIAGDPAGIFYATRTLLNLAPASAWKEKPKSISIACCEIKDSPRFGYRGMHVDVARNFHSKESIEKLLDQMAYYKLNRLHLHFSDDEGWRIEIPSLPELTSVGARRGHTTDEKEFLMPAYGSGPDPDSKSSNGNGYYSRDDYVALLKYANERHIQIIPEIELPGHARAAIVAMKARFRNRAAAGDAAGATEYLLNDPEDQSQYESIQGYHDNVVCICQPSVLRFVETVVDELASMYHDAGTQLHVVHIGGDEVPHGAWEKSPICKAFLDKHPEVGGVDGLRYWFLQSLYHILNTRKIKMAGWEEVGLKMTRVGNVEKKEPYEDLANKNVAVNAWNSVIGGGAEDTGYRLANNGYHAVLSFVNQLYLDMAQSAETDVPGAYWGGMVDLKTTFEVCPYDFTLVSRKDGQGNSVDRSTQFRKSVKLTEDGQKNVLGIQGQIWSETVRGPKMLQEYLFPRIIAIAERAWTVPPSWETVADEDRRDEMIEAGYAEFVATLGTRELPRLDTQGIGYYLPRPGVKKVDGKLHANTEFASLTIRYTTDGRDPTSSSPEYKEPLDAKGTIKLAVFDTHGRRSRVATFK